MRALTSRSMSRILKSLEYTAHSLRSYVLPSHIRAYNELSKRKDLPDGKLVVFDMVNTQIDNVMGRYLYHIVKDLHDQGYSPVYVSNYRFLATTYRKRYKKKLLEMPFSTISRLSEINRPYLYVTDRQYNPAPANSERVIRVSYAKRRPANETEIPLPFFVHPEISTQPAFPPQVDLGKKRNSRIFFGGNTRPCGYGDGPVNRVYKVMNRVHVMETVKGYIPQEEQCLIQQPFDALPEITFSCVETQYFKIPFDQWMQTMMQADFFLACPGTKMPLCHNLVEALCCGTIPIIQYHRYLSPELKDGINCLTFHDEESFKQALQRAVDMPQEEIQRLRTGALGYYQQHLTEGKFAHKLLNHPAKELALLINAYRTPVA